MGNYIFTTKVLIDAIRADADDDRSDHDMGGDIIPHWWPTGWPRCTLSDNEVPGATERTRPTGVTWDAGRVLRRAHGPVSVHRCSTCTTGAGQSLAHRRTWHRPSSSTAAPRRSRWWAPAASSRRHQCATRAVSNVVVDDGAIVEGSVIIAGRSGRSWRGGAARDPGQERRCGAGRDGRSRIWRGIGNASRSAPVAWSRWARASGSNSPHQMYGISDTHPCLYSGYPVILVSSASSSRMRTMSSSNGPAGRRRVPNRTQGQRKCRPS